MESNARIEDGVADAVEGRTLSVNLHRGCGLKSPLMDVGVIDRNPDTDMGTAVMRCWWLVLILAFLASPASALASCQKGMALGEITQMISEARDLYWATDFYQALNKLQKLEEALQCTAEPIVPEVLQRLYLLKGAVLLELDLPLLTKRAIQRSVSIAPSMAVDSDFRMSATVMRRYEAAKKQISSTVVIHLNFSDERPLSVDGILLAPWADQIELLAGEHILQLRSINGSWGSHWISIPQTPALTLQLGPNSAYYIFPTPDPALILERRRMVRRRTLVVGGALAGVGLLAGANYRYQLNEYLNTPGCGVDSDSISCQLLQWRTGVSAGVMGASLGAAVLTFSTGWIARRETPLWMSDRRLSAVEVAPRLTANGVAIQILGEW